MFEMWCCSFWKELSCFYNFYQGAEDRKSTGTTILAYKIVVSEFLIGPNVLTFDKLAL